MSLPVSVTNPDTGETADLNATVHLPRSHPFGAGRPYALVSLKLWALLDHLTPREFKVYRGLLDRMDRDNVMRQPIPEFASEMHIEKANLSRTLDSLEQQGFIWRMRGQDGRRIVGIMLNPDLCLKGTRDTAALREAWSRLTSPVARLKVIRSDSATVPKAASSSRK